VRRCPKSVGHATAAPIMRLTEPLHGFFEHWSAWQRTAVSIQDGCRRLTVAASAECVYTDKRPRVRGHLQTDEGLCIVTARPVRGRIVEDAHLLSVQNDSVQLVLDSVLVCDDPVFPLTSFLALPREPLRPTRDRSTPYVAQRIRRVVGGSLPRRRWPVFAMMSGGVEGAIHRRTSESI
jgi:hypothetical protein